MTHADLFFENPVKLPFLNIELPLLAFFFLAPILFLIVHAYTLVHLVMLTDKAKRFHQALHDQIGGDDGQRRSCRRAAIRDGLQRQLPSNIFVQFLAGPPDIRASLFGSLLRGIAWVTLVVAPVLLLLLMQLQFLPFHSSFITWTHRLALARRSDARVVAVAEILSGREIDRPLRASWAWPVLGLALSAWGRSILLDSGDFSRRVAGRSFGELGRTTTDAGVPPRLALQPSRRPHDAPPRLPFPARSS